MEVPGILLGVEEGFGDSFHHWGPLLMHESEGGQNETSASKAGELTISVLLTPSQMVPYPWPAVLTEHC